MNPEWVERIVVKMGAYSGMLKGDSYVEWLLFVTLEAYSDPVKMVCQEAFDGAKYFDLFVSFCLAPGN